VTTNRAAPLVLVTGATDGIGAQTAIELAKRGARVIVHGRNGDKAASLARQLGDHAEEPLVADLAQLSAVRSMAAQLVARGQALDVLINNAGVYCTKRQLTVDGFGMTMGVNHYAPLLLTHLLMPALLRSARGRIVNVSSIAHARGTIDLDDPQLTNSWDGYRAYAASKLANVLFTIELARRLRETRVTVNALHPGVVSTKLLKAGFGMQGPDSLADGAATSVFLALDPDVKDSGAYFVRCRPERHRGDGELATAFYLQSCELVGCAPLGSARRGP
jgi:NAD(P)-dependent dehydrogenase (short-subunit alcohol dehydrogenase family)